MVADSALYTAENLKQMTSLSWLTPVPFRLQPAQALAKRKNWLYASSGRRPAIDWEQDFQNEPKDSPQQRD